MASKVERLQEIMARLAGLPAASSFEEAYAQLCNTMNEVENELTNAPYNPSTWATDGRLYPPQRDSFRAHKPGVTRLVSRRNDTYIATNGAISIWTRPLVGARECLFNKAGADGRYVDDF